MTGETDLLQDEVSALRSEVRTLEADNAALVDALDTIGRTAWAVGASASSAAVRSLLAQPHPGSARLAEMDGLRARVTVSEERASVLTTERNALLEQVRNLTEERDGLQSVVEEMTAERAQFVTGIEVAERERDFLRARVADLESRLDTAEHERGELRAGLAEALRERDAAVAKAAIWEKAASLARDAALEEAAQVEDFSADDASGSGFTSDFDDEEGRKLWALVEERHRADANVIRALKSHPGRRFVDAEEVGPVLDLADQGLRNAISYGLPLEHHQEAVSKLLERLGLTLDGKKP